MYRIICISLSFFLFNSCDEKSIVFSPTPEHGLDFINQSFPLNLSKSSVTMTPEYIFRLAVEPHELVSTKARMDFAQWLPVLFTECYNYKDLIHQDDE